MKLSDKQKKFCEEYIIDFNQTQSAIKAGYSAKTAYSIGNENLKKPDIQAYIKELLSKREERTQITADMVVKEWAKIAFFDIRKIFHKEGGLLNPHDLDDETATVISSIKARDIKVGDDIETIKEYRLNDKMKALDMLAKHLGMFEKEKEDNSDTNVNLEIVFK